MTTRYAKFKQLAGLVGLATVVTAAAWGLGSGTAQADTTSPVHHVVVHVLQHRIDRNFDGHFEGTLIDRFFDHP
jgi:hypothetical protein